MSKVVGSGSEGNGSPARLVPSDIVGHGDDPTFVDVEGAITNPTYIIGCFAIVATVVTIVLCMAGAWLQRGAAW